jgi:hypothetical protein
VCCELEAEKHLRNFPRRNIYRTQDANDVILICYREIVLTGFYFERDSINCIHRTPRKLLEFEPIPYNIKPNILSEKINFLAVRTNTLLIE